MYSLLECPKLTQLRLCLATLLIQSKDKSSKINLKTVTKLTYITERRWWLPLNVTTLLHQESKSMKEHPLHKRNCATLRAIYLEQRSKEMSKIGNNPEEAKINYLLLTEISRDNARCLKYFQTRIKGSGFNKLRIKNPDVKGK